MPTEMTAGCAALHPPYGISSPLAGFRRLGTAAETTRRINSRRDAAAKAGKRPVARVVREVALHRVEVNVIHVSRVIAIIADRVLPVAAQPNARSPLRSLIRDAGSGNDFENAALILRQRSGKSLSASGRVHRQCIWSGNTTQASMRNGDCRRNSRTATRSASTCAARRLERRSRKFTVKK